MPASHQADHPLTTCCQFVASPGIAVQRLMQDVINHLRSQSCSLRELDVGHLVQTVQAPVDPLTFLRDYVSSNKPCLIEGAVEHWPALHAWDHTYLAAKAGHCQVTIDYTPNGRGDAITSYTDADGETNSCFCTPYTKQKLFGAFLSEFQGSTQSATIPYLQHQNSNLTEELPALVEDVDPELPWASAAFGAAPEAVNLWIGDHRSATTFHKDHYENMYVVLRGTKVFHLLPPTDCYRMALQVQPLAQYVKVGDELQPQLLQPLQRVAWCPIEPSPTDVAAAAAQYPLYFDPDLPTPLQVEVNAGQCLYLPAMWYHYVEQRCDAEQGWCVAVNYWYDMRFDLKYAAYELVEKLAQDVGLVPSLPPSEQSPEEGDAPEEERETKQT